MLHVSIETNSRLLTAADVAEILCISRSYAYQLMSRNEIASLRFGRSLRTKNAAINEYVGKSMLANQED